MRYGSVAPSRRGLGWTRSLGISLQDALFDLLEPRKVIVGYGFVDDCMLNMKERGQRSARMGATRARECRLRDGETTWVERLTIYNASLELSLDAGALEPVHLADGRELAIKQRVALDLPEQRAHVIPLNQAGRSHGLVGVAD